MRARRGMALIQALVIVAAVAAVSVALVARADRAVARLDARARADQAALYLDAGLDLVRTVLPQGTAHRRQDWARARDDIEIDRGVLAWQVTDLTGRFNLAWLHIDPDGTRRPAFVRLARQSGLSRDEAETLAAALVEAPALPIASMVRALAPAGTDPEALSRLTDQLAALPEGTALNLNTATPEVLAALLPQVPAVTRDRILRRVANDPIEDPEDFLIWAEASLGPPVTEALGDLNFGVDGVMFLVRLEARLDTLVLRRSVVVQAGDDDAPATVILSIPEPD